MANQTGIAITIKAFLPTGKTLDQQFAALTIVKEAHASGDYSALLKAANVEDVKTEQKTRRIEEQPAAPPVADGGDKGDQDKPNEHDRARGGADVDADNGPEPAGDETGGEPADADPNGDNLPASLRVRTGRRAA